MKHNHLKMFADKMGRGIKVTLWRDGQGNILCFSLLGHAGYGQDGEDIVCSAVSALAIAAANGLERFMKHPPHTENGDGYLKCEVKADSSLELDQAQWILQTMVMGLEAIQHDYGKKYLKIEYRG